MRGLELTVGAKTETSNCSVTATPRYGTVCAGEGNDNCFTSIVGYDYTTTCNSINPDDGSGGGGGMIGGGGGIHGPGPKPKGVTSDHGLIGKGSLPPNNTNLKQAGKTCVFVTIEWISKFFGGDITDGSALTDYAKSHNLNIAEMANIITRDGVLISELPEIINTYFVTTVPTSFNAAIDAGHPLFATLISSDGGHEVMITGYNNNGTIEYFDPELGKYLTKNPGDFSTVLEVLSHKH